MKKKLVITGGSGLLALNWAYVKRDEYNICLFTHNHQVMMPGVMSKQVDLLDASNIRKALIDFGPDLVVHTAGMTNVDECEKSPKEAHAANVDTTYTVAKVTDELGIYLVHISTDHLFEGKKQLVTEEETPKPINVYGSTKLKAEECVSEVYPDALVVRTNFYGWGNVRRTSFSDWILGTVSSGKSVSVFDDVYYTPILIDHLVAVIHDLQDLKIGGIVNIVNDERISKYNFAMIVAEQFRLDKSLINKGSIKNASLLAKRPTDMSLSNAKVKDLLQRPMGNILSGVYALKQQMIAGRQSHLNDALASIERTKSWNRTG